MIGCIWNMEKEEEPSYILGCMALLRWRLWTYCILITLPFSLPEPWRHFLGSSLRETGGIPGGKAHKSIRVSQDCGPENVCPLTLVHIQSSKFMAPVLFTSGKQILVARVCGMYLFLQISGSVTSLLWCVLDSTDFVFLVFIVIRMVW